MPQFLETKNAFDWLNGLDVFVKAVNGEHHDDPEPTRIIASKPYTIVMFSDGTKQVVKCPPDEEYSVYGGFVNALAVHKYGTNSALKKFIERHTDKPKEPKHKVRNKSKNVAPGPSIEERLSAVEATLANMNEVDDGK